tara:strand:+ start:341 stop:688 length:348 start_codon:yes stop_codon:yes gene_type:complete
MPTNTIPFGLTFRGQKSYTYSEVSNFIECADTVSQPLRDQYVTFLNNFLDGKIKPSTQVDIDVMLCFQDDLDNRADIDYREGHWDDDPNIVAGGKYFAKQAKKLMDHICNNVQIG